MLVIACLAACLALWGCSSSSSAVAVEAGALDSSTDGGQLDARAEAGHDAQTMLEAAPMLDAAEMDAELDAGPPQTCSAVGGCLMGNCCVVGDAGDGVCGTNCGCAAALACASASQCPTAPDVCCIQQYGSTCPTGSWLSTCVPACTTGTYQLCSPTALNECAAGSCLTTAKALAAVGLPADAGFGICSAE